jgi:hypothetical protein
VRKAATGGPAALVFAGAAASPAAAQQVTLEPSAIVRCLEPGRAERGLARVPVRSARCGAVGQAGNADPARRELTEWLRESELDLPKRSLDAVFGDETTITVPCIKIDLKRKEN